MLRSFLTLIDGKWEHRPKHLVKDYMERALTILVTNTERFDEIEQKNYRWSYRELLKILKSRSANNIESDQFRTDTMLYETALYVQEMTFLLPTWVDYYLGKNRKCPRFRVTDCIIVHGQGSLLQGFNEFCERLEDGEECAMPSQEALRFFARSLRFLKATLECIDPNDAINQCDRAFRKFTDIFVRFYNNQNSPVLRSAFIEGFKEFRAGAELVRDWYAKKEANLARCKNSPVRVAVKEAKAGAHPPRKLVSKFSQKEMAEMLHVSEDTIARWDKGESSPPAGYSRELRERGTLEQLRKFFEEYDGRLSVKDVWNSKHLVRNMSEEQMHRESLK